jgi:hypothetical protein
VLASLLAAAMLSLALPRLYRREEATGGVDSRWDRSLLLGALLAAFILGMEEMSWGQRIFGWATPPRLAEANLQGETTLHNLVSLKEVGLYRCLVLPTVLVLTSLWWHLLEPLVWKRHPALPHPALLPTTLILGLAALTYEHELLEELTAIWFLLYSVGVIASL